MQVSCIWGPMSHLSVETRIRVAGLRCTSARVVLLTTLENLAAPATHSEIAEQEGVLGMDSVTLYRTLETLQGAGFIHLIRGADGANRYCPQPRDQEGCPGNHPHFVCERCGAMRCLSSQILPRVEVPQGAIVLTRHFVASGICEHCSGETR